MRAIMGGAVKAISLQVTGGSSSTIDGYEKMRLAGRCGTGNAEGGSRRRGSMLLPMTLKAENGKITDPASGKSLTYGELALEAAKLTPPSEIKLKDRRDWKLLGKITEAG